MTNITTIQAKNITQCYPDGFEIGDIVSVCCPVFKNGKRVLGKVTARPSDNQYMVRLEGKKKSSRFAKKWVTVLSTELEGNL